MRGQPSLQAIGVMAYAGAIVLFFVGLAVLPGRMAQRLEAFNEARSPTVVADVGAADAVIDSEAVAEPAS